MAYYNVAMGYWEAERYADADDALRRAVRLNPRFADAHLALAYLPYAERPALWEDLYYDQVPFEWVERLRVAARHYQHALMIDPLVDMRIIGAVTPHSWSRWPDSELASRIYDAWFRGFDDFRLGDYESSFIRFNNLIRNLQATIANPDKYIPESIRLHRALAAAHTDRWRVAEEDLRLLYGRELDEESEDRLIHFPLKTNHYRYLLGFVLAEAGRSEEAAELLEAAATEDLGLYMAHVRLAELAAARGDAAAALRERTLAAAANPGDHTLLVELGVEQAAAGLIPEAAQTLRSAIEINPLDAHGNYFLGVLSQALGDAPAARDHLVRFIEIAPARFEAQIADAQGRLDAL